MTIVAPLIYRLPELRQAVGLSTTTIYELMNKDEFPRPVELSARCVGWVTAEVRAWLAAHPRRTGPLTPDDSET